MRLVVQGTPTRLAGELDIPVSKYHMHRALVLASLAEGTSVISGISHTRQADWTVGVLRALGTEIKIQGNDYIVRGGPYRAADVVDHGSRGRDGLLNVGSSGSTLYFVTGLASLADRPMTLTGMKYFRRRPIKALLDSLSQMGIKLESTNDCPPITVQPARPQGGHVSIAGTLSQWLTGLLLVAPFAESDTTITVTSPLNEQPYIDLTVRMMRHFGLQVEHDDDWQTYHIPANQTARPNNYVLPPDVGAAAFGIAAAALHPADVLFRGMSATRSADTDHPEAEFLDLATAMGVPMEQDPESGFVRIRHDGLALHPLDIDCQPIPDLLPALSTMAAFAEGTSRLHNVGHIRLKECDRVAAMLQLNRMGGRAEQQADELRITGVHAMHGAAMSSFNDHRVLMALSVAATRADGMSSLTYPRAYRVSYPAFLEAMNSVGLALDVTDPKATDSGYSRDHDDRSEDGGVEETLANLPVELAEPPLLTNVVRRKASRTPDGPAVIEVGGPSVVTTTWRELQEEADRVSALLLDLGVRRGEAVALQLPNWQEFVAITLGIVQIGAVATPVMPVFGPRETAMTLSRSRARVMFLPNLFRGRRPALELLDAADEAQSQKRPLALEHVLVLRTEDRHSQEVPNDVAPIPEDAIEAANAAEWTWRYYDAALSAVTPDAALIRSRSPQLDDVCQLLFTSGTTGEPKGVQQSHRTLSRAVGMEIQHLGLTAKDRIFIPSPLAHQTGFLYGMLLSWRLGVASVIQPVWSAETALRQAFAEAQATFVQAATPFLGDLVAAVKAGEPAPESLRIFVATGSAVPRPLAQEASTVLSSSNDRAAVLGAFGTTETCLVTASTPHDRPEDAWGTDGRPLPGIKIRIVDDRGVEVPVGAEGNYELWSPTIFAGYLDRPDLTAEVFTHDHWYRTGDLARIDDAGFLHITGRVKDVINRGGEKIPVVEVENLLYQHPEVVDVAIVAMPDPRLGERACAFIVPARSDVPLEMADVQAYLRRAGVSKYYWPERLEFVEALPRNAIGKIQKVELRHRIVELMAAESAR